MLIEDESFFYFNAETQRSRGFGGYFQAHSSGFLVSRSRAVVVLSRVEVEMGVRVRERKIYLFSTSTLNFNSPSPIYTIYTFLHSPKLSALLCALAPLRYTETSVERLADTISGIAYTAPPDCPAGSVSRAPSATETLTRLTNHPIRADRCQSPHRRTSAITKNNRSRLNEESIPYFAHFSEVSRQGLLATELRDRRYVLRDLAAQVIDRRKLAFRADKAQKLNLQGVCPRACGVCPRKDMDL